jgi:hypothetical protein
MQRVQPQAAGYTSPRIQYPAPLHLLNHGPSKIVITKHTLKSGAFVSDFMVCPSFNYNCLPFLVAVLS